MTFIPDTQICSFYGSSSAACGGVLNTVCTDTGVNSRTCACATGYAGPAELTGIPDNQNPFSGSCTGILSVVAGDSLNSSRREYLQLVRWISFGLW